LLCAFSDVKIADMPDDPKLVPLFVPPLAKMLAFAEQKKGSALTAAEVEAIRDKSACIMMEPSDAHKMAESHGYVDVNPENCWADWHRLRVEMTGRGYLPKIVLCVPGGDDLRARCEPLLNAGKVEYEFRGRDANMVRAFVTSSMTWPCFSADDFARIGNHTTVLYALSKNLIRLRDGGLPGRRIARDFWRRYDVSGSDQTVARSE
jgi:hypothetical protein